MGIDTGRKNSRPPFAGGLELDYKRISAPQVGLEPTTLRLTGEDNPRLDHIAEAKSRY